VLDALVDGGRPDRSRDGCDRRRGPVPLVRGALVRIEVIVWLLANQVLPTQSPRRQVQQFLEAPFVVQEWLLALRP
jgi:hypothetical protein